MWPGSHPSPVPSTLGSRGSAPAHHSCLRASAWPHCIPGAAWPPLFPPLALMALGPSLRPGQDGTCHSQDHPSKAINRILLQPPVPVVSPRVGGQWCPYLCQGQAHSTEDTAREPGGLVGKQAVAWRQPPGDAWRQALPMTRRQDPAGEPEGMSLGSPGRQQMVGPGEGALGLLSTLQLGARPTSLHGFPVICSRGTTLK